MLHKPVKSILLISGFAESLVNFRGALILALQANGWKVHVVAPALNSFNKIRSELEANGVEVHSFNMRRAAINPLADIRTIIELLRLLLRLRPDAVLGYTIKPVIYGLLAAWLAGVPRRFALITGLGYAFTGQEGQFFRRFVQVIARRLYGLSLRCAAKVFFQNPDDESLFRELGILPSNVPSVVVNGSGVDVARFSYAPLQTNQFKFLLIARLLGDKGVREYFQAARRVKLKHPDVKFVLVGSIDENPDSISQGELDTWVNSGIIDYLGRLSDVRPAIVGCSVYVLPSYREGTPRTVLEAMATGRAIITTNAPGCRETVVDGVNGFLIPVKSVDSLEVAMLKFIDTPSLAVKMGLASREIAEIKYDVNKVNSVMLREMVF